ncbi:hypothetical protein PoB_002302800 [Plakobranchus ocellatus]|uniref:Uncharacterized protein n=1 Tax=Plakobranchus ocellatus TaxID=259542 RepID=A0AAV3ZPN5_9GAST|nr:hypothetical protein PoB_002302800 [Plakobranchus ocellatus]
MREKPIAAPSGPTDFALGPALEGRQPSLPGRRPFRRARPSGALGGGTFYPGGGRSDGRGLAAPLAEIESTREEAVQAGDTYWGPGRS